MSSGARVTLSRSKTQEYILKAARTTAGTLPFFWKKLSFERSNSNGASSKDGNPEKQPTIKLSTLPFADNVQFWVKLAEDFVAIQMVTFFSKAFVHMRNLLTFVTVCAFLLLMAVTSYPFQPHRLLTIFLWIVILSVVLASLIVFVQAERNEVLSRISKTTPNQISLDRWFVTGIITYGVLPIVGLLATQVPEMQSLFSWVEPLLRAFK
jgi:magnesium-transporting ATPase (P-type)